VKAGEGGEPGIKRIGLGRALMLDQGGMLYALPSAAHVAPALSRESMPSEENEVIIHAREVKVRNFPSFLTMLTISVKCG